MGSAKSKSGGLKKVIVIGNGMVGYKFCEKLRKKASSDKIQLTVYGEEPRPAYDRVNLSSFFSGKTTDDLLMAPRSWYTENNIELKTSELVVRIDREKKSIFTYTGKKEYYDELVLATGSSAFVPPIKGVEKDGVFVYRTIEDLEAIKQYGKKANTGAVLGGGLLGLEAAKALIDMEVKASVIEFAPRLMPRQIDNDGSLILQSMLEKLDLTLLTGMQTREIVGDGKITGLDFTDDSTLDVDMLIISAGIRPRDELARTCDLKVGERGGIMVNDYMKTNDPNIYAIGETALHRSMIYGLVAPGYKMAEITAAQIAEEESSSFKGYDMSTKLKLIGVDVASFGDPFGAEDDVPITFKDPLQGIYKRINVTADGKYLTGGILVGDADDYSMLHQMFLNRMTCPEHPEDLILGARGDGTAGGPGIENLPAEAQICSCENISKGSIEQIICDKDLTEIGQIKSETKACTGCGGCTPLVTDLLNHTLKSMGKTVKNTLCEHFEYTRQELYDIIKVKTIKSYYYLLAEYGHGDGCETCKPAVASIMASIYAEIAPSQDTIQDTNDRFMANIQRGGTYSVVPRVPGGEITPEKLIVIGEVANKYNLYTKITGGQRIDMFGARVDQLPDIWKALVEAGFESGHAYGKALRTVKSCVGTSWCRYGVQDAVSFAIEIENRYKGMRSPHKIKSAVSGCTRECAEAQGKDFGLIATEKGWNLYVGGNGGANPQHAKLLATDLDNRTCIKLIDRFLMFYIKTAEPLMRTAKWLNNLEGGLEYLREVVINDSLGICEELEKDMQALVNGYECEWKAVVNNPELQERFKPFVNTEESDPSIEFIGMREQKMPIPWEK